MARWAFVCVCLAAGSARSYQSASQVAQGTESYKKSAHNVQGQISKIGLCQNCSL